MWADGNSKKKRVWSMGPGPRRNIVLGVSASASAQKRARMHNGVLLAGIPASLILMTVMMLWAGRWLFTGNQRFTVTRLEIKTGKLISEQAVRVSLGVAEGTNIFAFNIKNSRTHFMTNNPQAKSIVIHRQLPGTVKVEVDERTPVAKLGTHYPLYVDNEGYVFGLNGQPAGRFPLLLGYPDEVERPGRKVDAGVLSALEVVESADKLGLSMRIEQIDVSNPIGVTVYVVSGGVAHKGRIRWEGMGRRERRGAADLQERLTKIQAMLSTEPGRRAGDFDATRMDGCVSLLPLSTMPVKAEKNP